MANTILHKRSAVPAQTPNTTGLALGELAINTFDGKLYLKKDDGAESIIEIGGGAVGDLVITSTLASDVIASSKDLFQLTVSSQVGVDITDIPDFGFDTPSIAYSTNTASFTPPTLAADMFSTYLRPDGLAAYIIDSSTAPGTIYEFLLGTPGDVSTLAGTPNASYVMLIGDHTEANEGIWFNDTGTKAITSGPTEWAEYSFGVPYDLTTAVFIQSAVASGITTDATTLSFSQDGTKAYRTRKAAATSNWFITEYNVATPWDVSSIVLVLDTFEVTTETATNDPRGVIVNNDGTKIFIVSDHNATVAGSSLITEYTPVTPFSTAAMSVANQIVITESRFMRYMFWSLDGTDLYIMDNAKTIFQYSSAALTIGGITSTLYHNSIQRFVTTSTGVTVNGSIAFTGSNAQVALPNYETVNLPPTPITGGLAFDTDTGTIKSYDGASWIGYESADATILKSADIGVTVQAFDATVLNSADIGVTVQAFDATVLNNADIGVTVTAQELTINSQTGTAYTLVAADNGVLVSVSNAAAITFTVPTNASVPFPIGTQVLVEQEGAGQITIAGPGVTLNSAGGLLNTASQFSTLTLIKKAIDTWTVAGDLV